MKGKLLARVFRGLAAAVSERDDVPADEAELMLAQALGTAPLTPAQRSKRYRDTKKRPRDGSSRESVTKSDAPDQPAAPPSSPPLHSPSSLSPENPKDIAVVAEGSDSEDAREAAPAAADWMKEPLAWRAGEVIGNHALGEAMGASSWREVLAVWTAWHEARGSAHVPRPAEPFGTDESVLEVLKLLARGYLPSQLEAVARRLPKTEKYRGRVLLWSVMTPAIVDIELAAIDAEERARAPRRIETPKLLRRSEPNPMTPGEILAAVSTARAAAGGAE